jgi:hypothetical protein
MSHYPASDDNVTEYAISGLEAMLAGTLALMSAYAHGACNKHQELMALKIVSNLTCLQNQASLSTEFRQVLAKVSDSWRQHSLLSSSPWLDKAGHTQLHVWHNAPGIVQ